MKAKEMLDYNELISRYRHLVNCDGILRDFTLTIKGKEFYRNEQEIKYLKPGESIGVRYNDNENDFEINYIKMSNFSFDLHEVYIELYNNNELENLYKDYLEFDVLSYEEFLKNLKNLI
jgi:hypothetical protein